MIPNPASRVTLLQNLKSEIESNLSDTWLFPSRRGVGGFMGTSSLIIVGRRPAMHDFPDSDANKYFYDILTEYGLENAHLTNYIKTRGGKGEADPLDMAPHERILGRELEVLLGTQWVVPMGDAFPYVSRFLERFGAKPFYKLNQYASMNYGTGNIESFRGQIAEIASLVKRAGL
jgi:hypothetical protein